MAAPIIPEQTDARLQVADLNLTAEKFAPLDDELTPLTANAEQLAAAGYPPKPDAETQAELFEVWREIFGPNPEFERALLIQLFSEEEQSYSGSTSAALRRSHYEASLNWSGAYITPRQGEMFTQVVGMWRVPAVDLPPDGSAPWGSSTWIGLDGQRSYFHSTLPQLGTAQYLDLPNAPGSTSLAWVQWWPLYPFTLHMKVVPGDLMGAWLVVLSYTKVLFVLVNVSRRRYTPFALPSPMVSMPPQVPGYVQAQVSGATAEWIMERPGIPPDPTPLPLPHFQPVTFRKCLAVTSPEPLASVRLRKLVSPKLIRMYSIEEHPHRAVTRAVAARPSPTRVKVTYRV